MEFKLSDTNSIANRFIAELRDARIQQDRMRFRKNLERIGEVLAYEISKKLKYEEWKVETPVGLASVSVPKEDLVIGTILRAGLPMHQGMLNFFDSAGSAFVSAYRRHHKDGSFEIKVEYISCPDLEDRVLILTDPMLATGASMDVAIKELHNFGKPAKIHIATAIASTYGLERIRRLYPEAYIWMGAVDEELTAKSYIVPGLGDAGDLSFGAKVQE